MPGSQRGGALQGPVAVFSGGGTGGHLYPALALAEALRELVPDLRPVFVGAERGLEARVLPERGVEHILLPVQGLQRGRWVANLGVLLGLIRSMGRVLAAFQRLRPRLVVVTGGYAGGPAGLAAILLGLRLVLQEQNAVPGLTTRVLGRWAREVHVAFPEAVDALPRRVQSRAVVSGNPVHPPETRDLQAERARFGLPDTGPVALVVGGSQGSRSLNEAMTEALTKVRRGELDVPHGLSILWATGPAHRETVEDALSEAGGEVPAWVRLMDYIHDMPGALAVADVAVSRAGAMATSEFLAWGVPAVLVPLPWAAADHQTRNAQALEEAGAAVHLPESRLDGSRLWGQLRELVETPDRLEAMGRAAERRGSPDASRTMARALARHLDPAGAGKGGA